MRNVNRGLLVFFGLLDIAINTLFYCHGSKACPQNFWNVKYFDIYHDIFDTWLINFLRACFILGFGLYLYCGSPTIKCLNIYKNIVIIVCLLSYTYLMIKLLVMSEKILNWKNRPYFWCHFSWSFASIVITFVLINIKIKQLTKQVQILNHKQKLSLRKNKDNHKTNVAASSYVTPVTSARKDVLVRKPSPELSLLPNEHVNSPSSLPEDAATLKASLDANSPTNDKTLPKETTTEQEEENADEYIIPPSTKQLVTPMLRIINYALPDYGIYSIAFLFLFIAAIADIFQPYYMGKVIDGIVIGKSYKQFSNAILIMSIISIVSAFAAGVRGCYFTVCISRLNLRVRKTLFASLLHQDMAFFDEVKTGELTSRISADTSTLSDLIGVNLNMFLRSIVKGAGVCIFMFTISWQLSMITVLALPLFTYLSKVYGKFYERLSEKTQHSLAKSNETTQETLSSIRTVKSFAGENSEILRYSRDLKKTYRLMKRGAILYAGYMWSSKAYELAILILILYYGGHLVLNKRLSGGAFVSFLLYQLQLGEAIASIGNVFTGLMQAIGSSKKVFELIYRIPNFNMEAGRYIPKQFDGKITFSHVYFSYPTRKNVLTLKDVSFEVKPGEIVAIVGPSGSGKSSCLALLQNFYPPDRGTVCIDDIPVSEYDYTYLHQKMALVSQEPTLFARTIRDNISYPFMRKKFNKILGIIGAASAALNQKLSDISTMIRTKATRLSVVASTIVDKSGGSGMTSPTPLTQTHSPTTSEENVVHALQSHDLLLENEDESINPTGGKKDLGDERDEDYLLDSEDLKLLTMDKGAEARHNEAKQLAKARKKARKRKSFSSQRTTHYNDVEAKNGTPLYTTNAQKKVNGTMPNNLTHDDNRYKSESDLSNFPTAQNPKYNDSYNWMKDLSPEQKKKIEQILTDPQTTYVNSPLEPISVETMNRKENLLSKRLGGIFSDPRYHTSIQHLIDAAARSPITRAQYYAKCLCCRSPDDPVHQRLSSTASTYSNHVVNTSLHNPQIIVDDPNNNKKRRQHSLSNSKSKDANLHDEQREKAEGNEDRKIVEAAKLANAHQFILGQPGGYGINIGERGSMLSGGQRQRIALARALVRDPSILLLDEATSALDAESEYLVQEAITKNLKGKTVLIIAHRLSTVQSANRILVMSNGELVEQGTHAELLALGGVYTHLVQRQMQGYTTNTSNAQEHEDDITEQHKSDQEKNADNYDKHRRRVESDNPLQYQPITDHLDSNTRRPDTTVLSGGKEHRRKKSLSAADIAQDKTGAPALIGGAGTGTLNFDSNDTTLTARNKISGGPSYKTRAPVSDFFGLPPSPTHKHISDSYLSSTTSTSHPQNSYAMKGEKNEGQRIHDTTIPDSRYSSSSGISGPSHSPIVSNISMTPRLTSSRFSTIGFGGATEMPSEPDLNISSRGVLPSPFSMGVSNTTNLSNLLTTNTLTQSSNDTFGDDRSTSNLSPRHLSPIRDGERSTTLSGINENPNANEENNANPNRIENNGNTSSTRHILEPQHREDL